MISSAWILAALFAVTAFVRWYRWIKHNAITHIRGPTPKSRFLGQIREFSYQKNVGDDDFAWVEEYGPTFRIGGPLYTNALMTCDPKALQHIFHKSGYNYPKESRIIIGSRLVTGRSIVWAPSGDDHARHRKVMNPAFTAPQLRSFLPLFRRSSNKMCQMWKDDVLSSTPEGQVLKVNHWLARTTLDVIGEAAFDYPFGALDDNKNELSEAYHNMFLDSVLYPARWKELFQASWRYLPDWLTDYVEYVPTREYKRFRRTLKIIGRIAKDLIDKKASVSSEDDKASKDVMSILVRANASEDARTRLNETEMVSQIAALTLAGHETTANTITWLLWELSKYPEYQEKMRTEIRQKRAEIAARGGVDFTMEDLESMVYLQAALKETLRYHPIVYHLTRDAAKDDVLPLSNPIVTATGETISEIPIAAGQVIQVSICAYNRLKSVWGDDANDWNPMRFIETGVDQSIRIGMFGNLMSFSAGVRGCIGWRFSMIEMQAIATDLLENFKFALPEDKPEIMRLPTGLMSPIVKTRMGEGLQMPLHVTAL